MNFRFEILQAWKGPSGLPPFDRRVLEPQEFELFVAVQLRITESVEERISRSQQAHTHKLRLWFPKSWKPHSVYPCAMMPSMKLTAQSSRWYFLPKSFFWQASHGKLAISRKDSWPILLKVLFSIKLFGDKLATPSLHIEVRRKSSRL